MTRRVVLFAHYDKDDMVDAYVMHYLTKLAALGPVVFVSTSRLSRAQLAKVRVVTTIAETRRNIGYDFMSWKLAWQRAREGGLLDEAPYELVMCNDSVYAPLFPLAEMFEIMAGRNIDHWAITGCGQIAPHLQSYFRVFRQAVLLDPLFAAFWDTMTPVADKMDLVTRYEVGFCQALDAAGYVGAAYFAPGPTTKLQLRLFKAPSLLALQCDLDYNANLLSAEDIVMDGYNVSLSAWPMLVYSKVPSIKVMLLRENPASQLLEGLLATIERVSDYDVNLVRNHLARMQQGSHDINTKSSVGASS